MSNKVSRTEDLLHGYRSIHSEMSNNLKVAILNHLKNATPRSVNQKKRDEGVYSIKNANYNLTSDEVTEIVARKEEEIKEKVDKSAAYKARKAANLVANSQESISNSIDRAISNIMGHEHEKTTDILMNTSEDGLSGKRCCDCKAFWSTCIAQSDWKACEECPNWTCFYCSSTEDCCKMCQLNSK